MRLLLLFLFLITLSFSRDLWKVSCVEMNQVQLTSCRQSTQYKGSSCTNAIKTNSAPDAYIENRCAHVGKENGWWSAKTVTPAHVKKIRILNRDNGFRERLNDFTISVDGVECVRHKSSVTFLEKLFDCDVVGQEIKISSNLEYLTLCKVDVFGEYIDQLQLTTCKQSSDYRSSSCTKAINNTFPQKDYYYWNCAHGGKEDAWWSAKTVLRAHIRKVRIFNRVDCCRERLNDFAISVDGVECVRHKSSVTFFEKLFDCDAVGQEIKISSNLEYLTLCKVEVFGEYVGQLSLGFCKQSSVFYGHLCTLAIDNNSPYKSDVLKRCSHLEKEPGWWSAKTVTPAHIKRIRILNRDNCCRERLNDFAITVDGVECVRHKSSVTFLEKFFDCDAIGQEIKISSNLEYLTLCKVEVFGKKIGINYKCNEVHVNSQTFCILQQRLDGSVQFNRTWDEYENGFGDSRNFWTGLRWLHDTTSKSSNLMFRAELTNWVGEMFVAEYSGFVVKDASQRYAMDYKSFLANTSTVTADSLLLGKGRKFSTMDQDNDDSERSCSTAYSGGAGWWFGSCSTSNPNGQMVAKGSSNGLESAHWYGVTNVIEPLKSIRLLIQKPPK